MPSSLAWLDFSQQEQERVLNVVELFRERDTVDELGVGVVRDTFSDLLFPGTSTLHARGRYVLFIPWIYQAIERSPTRCQDPWRHARAAEIRLIDSLVNSEDGEAAMGAVAGAALKVFPSTVYWAALATWGMRLFPFSQDQYHRWLRAGGHRGAGPSADEDDSAAVGSAWHANLPPQPEGFPREVSFRFEPYESAYVAERVAMKVPGSLLALLVEQRIDVRDIEYPWQLAGSARLPRELDEQLGHASRFSLVIRGAPLMYNLMLAEKSSRPDKDDLRADFEQRLTEWAEEVQARSRELQRWDRRAFWDLVTDAGTRTPPPTRRFIDRWLDLVTAGEPKKLALDKRVRRLISERERQVKRGRARLHNAQALALWGGDAGTGRMVFRWPYVQRIVGDVVAGLGVEDA